MEIVALHLLYTHNTRKKKLQIENNSKFHI